MINQEPLHFQKCLCCGKKTLIYPNGFCRECRTRKEVARVEEEYLFMKALRKKVFE